MKQSIKLSNEQEQDVEYVRKKRYAIKLVDDTFDEKATQRRLKVQQYLWKEKNNFLDKQHKNRLDAIKESAKWR